MDMSKRSETLSIRITKTLMDALQEKAGKENLSKGDVVEKALTCFLGLQVVTECNTYSNEIETLKNRFEQLIKVNNLKEV